ncbi:ABC transporter related protein [Solidesulfovibrio fructosivorans JJ]]|uniref:ABC transporter related protein n=1 Tax=Solidesulfovibrio fructosivorans JJ] TaxID=596151 RepID=E1JRN5_SOLFR|nr:ABC transporter ATP-binding protein [Solidesulfovibrio fructosivorans]EFL53236.1 ABC transporter related protein [Solidesulfovibrio fructosivorans JJ]]
MSLSARNLSFAYNGAAVLTDVSLRLEPGRVTAILGVNGAGKSTLLKCLGGLIRPQRGGVALGEKKLGELSRRDAARRIAYVPQSQQAEGMTVFEAVLLGRRPHMGLRPSRRDMGIVEGVLTRLGLSALAFRRLDALSGGEMQKTAIARALVQEPDVLLLDEPTASLDLKNMLEVFAIVRQAVTGQGVAAAAVLHDLSQAMRFADDFVLLSRGAVLARVDAKGLTPEIVRAVYGVDVAFGEVGGHPVAAPLGVADAA